MPRIEPGTRVGAYTFIAGYAGIDRDAPPFAMVQGFPFRVRGVNTQNLKRCGFGEETIAALKQAFRCLFNGDGDQVSPDAIRAWAAANPMDEALRYLVDSLLRSRPATSDTAADTSAGHSVEKG